MFAPIGINKLYHPLGELVPAKIAGELGIPVCINIQSWCLHRSHPRSIAYPLRDRNP